MKYYLMWGMIIALSAFFTWILVYGFYIVLFPKRDSKKAEQTNEKRI